MKVVDANVLIYAVNEDEAHHDLARSWLQSALAGDEEVGFTWLVILAFLRVTTRWVRLAQGPPITTAQALDIVNAWLGSPAACLVVPGPRHLDTLRELLESVGRGGDIVQDAHLAALALEHRAEVVSFDTDFARFPGLRWQRPR